METCTITGTVVLADGVTPRAGGTLYVRKVLKDGELVSTKDLRVPVGQDGAFSFTVPRDSTAWVEAMVEGFDRQGGVPVTIPDAAAALLKNLMPARGAPSTAVSQAAFSAALAWHVEVFAADGTLDMGSARRALVLIDSSAGDVTVILPPAAGAEGREVYAKKLADDNLGILDADGSEAIDGQLVFNLEMNNQAVHLFSDGVEWHVL